MLLLCASFPVRHMIQVARLRRCRHENHGAVHYSRGAVSAPQSLPHINTAASHSSTRELSEGISTSMKIARHTISLHSSPGSCIVPATARGLHPTLFLMWQDRGPLLLRRPKLPLLSRAARCMTPIAKEFARTPALAAGSTTPTARQATAQQVYNAPAAGPLQGSPASPASAASSSGGVEANGGAVEGKKKSKGVKGIFKKITHL